MAVDLTKPTPTTARADNLTYTVDNLVAVAKQLDDTTPTGVATGMIRWSSTNSKWQKYNGTTWADLASTYSINVSTFGGQAASYYTDIAARLGYAPVNKAGDTMTGYLTLNGAPTSNLHAATKKYVDDLSATSGTWTPTAASITNVASTTTYLCRYSRVGDTVTVSGVVDVDPTAADTGTVFDLTLPIASGFTAVTDANGTFNTTSASRGGVIYANATDDRLRFSLTPQLASALQFYFCAQYVVK